MFDRQDLLKLKNVVGYGKGFKIVRGKRVGLDAVSVLVEKKMPTSILNDLDIVPKVVEGVPTDVVQVGKIRALGVGIRDVNVNRVRPAPGGVSVGHKNITAGTFALAVKLRSGERVMLSNNHVFANSNAGQIGDEIVQPGPYDGGLVGGDTIAHLYKFVPVEFMFDASECLTSKYITDLLDKLAQAAGSFTRFKAFTTRAVENLVDAAIAMPISGADIADEIVDIGDPPKALAEAELGMKVHKSGRTTGLTLGEITQTDLTVNVGYDSTGTKIATFVDQVAISPAGFSAPGDSGSAILATPSDDLVAHLFAGSDQITIASRIQNVFELLELQL